MNLPRRRRSRPKGRARLALAGDFPDTGESVTEILDRVRPADYDGSTVEFTGASDIGRIRAAGHAAWDNHPRFGGASDIGVMVVEVTGPAPLDGYQPAPASFPALPARTPQHQARRPDTRPGDGTWDRSPQALRAAAGALREQPAPRPPAIHPLPPELPPHEGLPAVQVTAMLGAIRYPRADGTPEDYAAVMRRWSHLTGTESGLESPGAWPRHAIAAYGTAAS